MCGVGDGWVDLWTLELHTSAGSRTTVQEATAVQGQHGGRWSRVHGIAGPVVKVAVEVGQSVCAQTCLARRTDGHIVVLGVYSTRIGKK